jgi:hypothetical protein
MAQGRAAYGSETKVRRVIANHRDGHANVPARRPGLTAAVVPKALLLIALLAMSGCRAPSLDQHGSSRVTAAYQGRTLSAELPDRIRPPAVIAAAEQSLTARGYTIVDREATADAARVLARPPAGHDLKNVVIRSELSRSGTMVWVRQQPFGDEAISRAILDSVLRRLGA